jgi:hypothetical protein
MLGFRTRGGRIALPSSEPIASICRVGPAALAGQVLVRPPRAAWPRPRGMGLRFAFNAQR